MVPLALGSAVLLGAMYAPAAGSPLAKISVLVTAAGAAYGTALTAHPLTTNMCTAAVLSGFSDLLAQSCALRESRRKGGQPGKLEARRLGWMLLWGFVVKGFVLNIWFRCLESWFPAAGMTMTRALKKVLVDLSFESPTFNTLFFGYAIATSGNRGRNSPSFLAEYRDKLAKDLLPTVVRSFVFWGVVQFLNFQYVPGPYAQTVTNAAFVAWTAYVSFIGHRPEPDGSATDAAAQLCIKGTETELAAIKAAI